MEKEIMKGCHPGGDYHEFYHGNWPLSIFPPNGTSEECYIDIYEPKAAFSTDELKLEDRLYITSDCQNGCRSLHNKFKISNQPFIKYGYAVKRQNVSGELIF